MQKLDSRILDLLKKRGIETEKQIEEFVNPDIKNMLDPFDLDGMSEAVEKIRNAIENHKKIVVYGDYDCDGISACTILYKYFLSKGVKADVYIPNRFDDGYGLSFDMIDEIKQKSNPDLMITVDLGVTAVKEVEKIKSLGIDIIITDHHEPAETLPDTIVIDPKKPGQKYAFNGLCGAGVALKVVEALEGREEIKKYLDIAGVATIGDIVPLVSENRIIAKLGIEMLNNGKGLKSLSYMLSELDIKDISGIDVAFKIVPRLNASGRMSQGKKVFDFLVEEDDMKMKQLYQNIMKDNDDRLESIFTGVQTLENEMQKVDLSKDNIILLKGEFHQGVLGILASRICHDYNRPAIIFTKTEEGTLKGSGRSLDTIDLHNLLMQTSDKLIRFGGHKMAVGVELEEDKFDEFKKQLSALVNKTVPAKTFTLKEQYDIEIHEQDINKDFISQLKILEPFGCQNEKPVFMLAVNKLVVNQMKDNAYKHYKISTKNGKNIMCFNGYKNVETLRSNVKKHLIVELENNTFKGKTYPQAILRDVFVKELKIEQDSDKECILSLENKFESEKVGVKNLRQYNMHDLEKLLLQKQSSLFGTIVVVDSFKVAERLSNFYNKLKTFTLSNVPLKNKQNTILISHNYPMTVSDFAGYKDVIFTRTMFSNEKTAFAEKYNVYVPFDKQKQEQDLLSDRNVNIKAYNIFKKNKMIKANSLYEWIDKVYSVEGGLSKVQLAFSLLSFSELGFVNINFAPEFSVEVVENPPKRELSSSNFMKKLATKKFN